MTSVLRLGVVIALTAGVTGCANYGPTSPTAALMLPPVAAPAPPPSSRFPPLTGSSRTYAFSRELSYRVSDYTRNSRFVLFDNGAFVLQYGVQFPELRGGYTETNGVVLFVFEGWNGPGPWGATAVVEGDQLTVRFNLEMQLSDFEDAVYQRLVESVPTR